MLIFYQSKLIYNELLHNIYIFLILEMYGLGIVSDSLEILYY